MQNVLVRQGALVVLLCRRFLHRRGLDINISIDLVDVLLGYLHLSLQVLFFFRLEGMLLPLRQVVRECRVLVCLERGGSKSKVVGCRGNGCVSSHRIAKQHVAELLLAVTGLLLGGQLRLMGLILVVEMRWKDLGHGLV